ncbi:hypothetical protein HKD37_07G020045 [Glycine soja]
MPINGDLKKTAIGGIFRNSLGHVILSFSADIGFCFVMASNSLLEVVFQVETDSQIAITLLTTGCPTYHPCFSLTQEILKFLELGGSISWHHALREGNQVADCLAKFGLSYLTRLKKIVNSPI